jgi:hypothetical protein
MTLEQIVSKMKVKRELRDKIDAAVDVAFEALEPRPVETPIKRRKLF